jgi:hypothetical protein
MRVPGLLWCIGVLLATSELALGQAQIYQPLGTWVDPGAQAYAQWNARVLTSDRFAPTKPNKVRPALPEIRPRSVELLEGYLLRKHPKLLSNDPKRARQLIVRRYKTGPGPYGATWPRPCSLIATPTGI